jgi:geranylgeranyl diphosphate synthase, type I
MATTEETTSARSAAELLAWSRSLVDPALHRAVDTLPDSMRVIAGHHFGWWDEHGDPVRASGGKAIRPALALLAAEAAGGHPDTATPAAVAVELVHSFSLLHDDVMDGDMTRRHRPTTWAVFGVNAAILAGDALLTLAFDVLAAGGHPAAPAAMRRLSTAVQDLVEGQSADVSFEQRADVVLPECLTMAERKTAALLGCACGIGALFGGGSAGQVERLRRFGERLGLAFQLVDDLLGIWGDSAVTGKPVYSDLRQRKKSLPVVAALTSGTPAGRELAELYGRDRKLSDAELVRAAELIDRAGGRAWCRAKSDEVLAGALHELWSADPRKRAAAELAAVARMVTRRDH